MAAPTNPTDELVRMFVIQLRRQVPTQSEVIAELSKSGFMPSRIAELLGTTPGTVQASLQASKKASKAPGKKMAAKKASAKKVAKKTTAAKASGL